MRKTEEVGQKFLLRARSSMELKGLRDEIDGSKCCCTWHGMCLQSHLVHVCPVVESLEGFQ